METDYINYGTASYLKRYYATLKKNQKNPHMVTNKDCQDTSLRKIIQL